jgi:hypothetical protein
MEKQRSKFDHQNHEAPESRLSATVDALQNMTAVREVLVLCALKAGA